MSFWKILGGAVVGVGAIAAAPFTGGGSLLGAATLVGSLSGAGTIAAAVAAGTAGAAIGESMGDETSARNDGYREGQKNAKAEYEVKVQSLELRLQTTLSKLKESSNFFDAVIAMEAVAISAANCDGFICDQERAQIDMFISGLSQSLLPESIKQKILDIYKKPLNIKEAMVLANKSGMDMEVFDDIIALVINADGTVNTNEHAFVQTWSELKAA